MKRPPIKRFKSLSPVSAKRRKRSGVVGKAGIVRLYGDDLETLRMACFVRDSFRCNECDAKVCWDSEDRYVRGEMAHIRTKRNNGDTLDNVRTLCPQCHRNEHNAGGKPVPAKEQRDATE